MTERNAVLLWQVELFMSMVARPEISPISFEMRLALAAQSLSGSFIMDIPDIITNSGTYTHLDDDIGCQEGDFQQDLLAYLEIANQRLTTCFGKAPFLKLALILECGSPMRDLLPIWVRSKPNYHS